MERDGQDLVIRHHGGFHGLNPAALYRTIKYVIVLYERGLRPPLSVSLCCYPPSPRYG